MVKYCDEFGSKKFNEGSLKESYLKAMKWYSTNILANPRLNEVQVEIKKDVETGSIELVIYAVLPANEVKKRHCEICKEIHKSFFINESNNCETCSASGYQRRVDSTLRSKISYYRDILKKEGKG